MNNYVLLDEDGFVTSYSFSDNPPDKDWVEIKESVSKIEGAGTLVRLIDGKLIVSDTPTTPPNSWSELKRGKWVGVPELRWQHIRQERDAKLAQTDFRVLRSMEDGKPMTKAWKDYRQALRDITKQPDPFKIVWPEPPAE